jgi:hypothetical protein
MDYGERKRPSSSGKSGSCIGRTGGGIRILVWHARVRVLLYHTRRASRRSVLAICTTCRRGRRHTNACCAAQEEVYRPRLADLSRWEAGKFNQVVYPSETQVRRHERGSHPHLMISYHRTTFLGGLFQLGAFQENREADGPVSGAMNK